MLKACLGTEQSMHAAWRKRAEEAEERERAAKMARRLRTNVAAKDREIAELKDQVSRLAGVRNEHY
jgi:hypothetical protein